MVGYYEFFMQMGLEYFLLEFICILDEVYITDLMCKHMCE